MQLLQCKRLVDGGQILVELNDVLLELDAPRLYLTVLHQVTQFCFVLLYFLVGLTQLYVVHCVLQVKLTLFRHVARRYR